MVQYYIDQITINTGDKVEFSADSLIIFVGANSSGKSTTLREMVNILSYSDNNKPNRKIVNKIIYSQKGDIDQWINWLSSDFQIVTTTAKGFRSVGGEITEEDVTNLVRDEANEKKDYFYNERRKKLSKFLVRSLDAESRLELTHPVTSIDVLDDAIKHEFHSLQLNPHKLELINAEIKAAFGKELIMDYVAGPEIDAYTIEYPDRIKEPDKSSIPYRKELREHATLLHRDGDGIRSFTGCLLALHCSPYKVFLVDEPEAFLHPPQARALGRVLVDVAKREHRQIFAATHSSDFIKGALDSTAGTVQICRIERIDNTNRVHTLRHEDLEQLWKLPLLKSTDAIQGAFHKGVIVCEADADCRFYEAILAKVDIGQSADLHFVHGGSKHQLSTLANSYTQLHVPVAAIADFDLLRTESDLSKLVRALGHNFETIAELYRTVSTALKGAVTPHTKLESTSDKLVELAEKLRQGKTASGEEIAKLTKMLQGTQDWSEPKKYGVSTLRGPDNSLCRKLLEELEQLGIFVVDVGEIESWDQALAGKTNKSGWILKALEKLEVDPHLFSEAKAFVRRTARFLLTKRLK